MRVAKLGAFVSEQEPHIQYSISPDGELVSVQLSPVLWQRVKSRVLAAEQWLLDDASPYSRPEPLEAVEELKKYWDFKYPYAPDVHCDQCGTISLDWENDPLHPFHLTNANFAGLLVFKCKNCGSTVRKKHFKDHMVFECSAFVPKG